MTRPSGRAAGHPRGQWLESRPDSGLVFEAEPVSEDGHSCPSGLSLVSIAQRKRDGQECPSSNTGWLFAPLDWNLALLNDTHRFHDTLKRGIAPGGNLREELRQLGEYLLTSYFDAGVLIDVMRDFIERPVLGGDAEPDYRELVGLYQSVLETDAFQQLTRRGIPLLIEAYDARLPTADEREGDLLTTLRIFARYGDEDGLDRVVTAATNPALCDGYLWPAVFDELKETDPILPQLIRRLAKPLPDGFARVAYLDWTNRLTRKAAITKHPFNTPAGIEILRAWLISRDDDDFSFAHSATAAIPFLSEPARAELLVLAQNHPDIEVRMEAAWAAARRGNAAGREFLVRQCLDFKTSMAARNFLIELDAEKSIPPEANAPEFHALAKMCEWLLSPLGYGRQPDEIKLLDTRHRHWPPARESRTLWLFEYRYRPEDEDDLNRDDADATEFDEVGVGMVGGITHSLTDETSPDMPIDDIYALHCCWELEFKLDPRAPEKRTVEAGRTLIAAAIETPLDPLEDFPFDNPAWGESPPVDGSAEESLDDLPH